MVELDVFSRKIADVLRELASSGEWTQSSLAELSGVSQGQISRIFRHQRSVSLEDLSLIAAALGTTASKVAGMAERSLEEQADEHSKPDGVINFPRAQEENLPDFTKLAARKVTTRPNWEAIQALNDIGEENQIDPYELD